MQSVIWAPRFRFQFRKVMSWAIICTEEQFLCFMLKKNYASIRGTKTLDFLILSNCLNVRLQHFLSPIVFSSSLSDSANPFYTVVRLGWRQMGGRRWRGRSEPKTTIFSMQQTVLSLLRYYSQIQLAWIWRRNWTTGPSALVKTSYCKAIKQRDICSPATCARKSGSHYFLEGVVSS